jgi:hypothetical protein
MTRGEWVKSRTDKRGWKAYHNARAHFPLCVLGRIVVLHHMFPDCLNYEDWNVNEMIPMFVWCHKKFHAVSEETRKKISESNKSKKRSLEVRLKLALTWTGRKHSEETKNKISEAQKGRKKTPEHIAKIANTKRGKPHRGVPRTEEQKRKQSNAMKGRQPPNKGKPMSDEQKRLLSKIYHKRKALAVVNG